MRMLESLASLIVSLVGAGVVAGVVREEPVERAPGARACLVRSPGPVTPPSAPCAALTGPVTSAAEAPAVAVAPLASPSDGSPSDSAVERRRRGRARRAERLRASPRALAAATSPDLCAIAAARGPEALPEQLALLLDPTRPTPVREAAARALASVSTEQADGLLLEAAARGDEVARSLSASALAGRAGGPEALERLLEDAAPAVRLAAAAALEVGATAAVDPPRCPPPSRRRPGE